ncbi:thermonuclease family protein [Roseospira marina]|uniref:Thermonuclease family protein n=1 Tax=Roseospira marina TaxID=140057 RepID=A0A5M6IC70_9PROT|nr:thermonuclease family protein [Roseospira marina]KAA5605841.1 thermonuclease family protein [Roseospira marina]MBB4313660.1 endonuclease YncB(thermonuclease family) [Roseospira marina]MBB5086822.1 endonuclease YncB(thermonuclease family) [Roseospira marina]
MATSPSASSRAGPVLARRIAVGGALALLAGAMGGTTPVRATPERRGPAAGLSAAPVGVVRAVTDAGELVLEDGRRIRLAALHLPCAADLPQDTGPEEAARLTALAAAARDALRAWAVGWSVVPWTPRLDRDRYGRVLAQVVVGQDRPVWLQAALIAAGLARVETMPGVEAGAARLLRLEAVARRHRRGLWRDPLYQPRAPDATWPWIGTFQIVRGTVRAAAKVRSRVYLNFGADWRRDFTVRVDRPSAAGFRTADLLDLTDQYVQVRGWLYPTNGPMINLDHPTALETRVILE